MVPPRAIRLLLALLVLSSACARLRPRPQADDRDLPLTTRVQAPGMLFELLYTLPDRSEASRIGTALLSAGPRLARWGPFRQGVHVRVYPTHEALERAVARRNYPWLRAWAFTDRILLQSPRSWPEFTPSDETEDLDELLTHELTHSLMYQLMEPVDGSFGELDEPPLWFREGMASVTAGQGHRRMTGSELEAWIAAHPGEDPLNPTPELYRTEKEAVYGAAHRAFALLVAISGDQSVRDILRLLRDGARFADAFKAATGHGLGTFEHEAVRCSFDPLASRWTPHGETGAGGP